MNAKQRRKKKRRQARYVPILWAIFEMQARTYLAIKEAYERVLLGCGEQLILLEWDGTEASAEIVE